MSGKVTTPRLLSFSDNYAPPHKQNKPVVSRNTVKTSLRWGVVPPSL